MLGPEERCHRLGIFAGLRVRSPSPSATRRLSAPATAEIQRDRVRLEVRWVVLYPHRDSVPLDHQNPVADVLTSEGRPTMDQTCPGDRHLTPSALRSAR
jgi:hypothetical protein